MMKELGKLVWEVVKEMDWKKIAYEAYTTIIKQRLEEKAKSSESKIDDMMVNGLNSFVEKFLKP